MENKIWFENSANAWGNYRILYHKTNKEASTELCSVVKRLGSGRALKKWGKTRDCVSCFPLHFFRALPLPACFTTEQSTVEASLFVKSISKRLLIKILKRDNQLHLFRRLEQCNIKQVNCETAVEFLKQCQNFELTPTFVRVDQTKSEKWNRSSSMFEQNVVFEELRQKTKQMAELRREINEAY